MKFPFFLFTHVILKRLISILNSALSQSCPGSTATKKKKDVRIRLRLDYQLEEFDVRSVIQHWAHEKYQTLLHVLRTHAELVRREAADVVTIA